MKLLYITNARIPTEKAHGLQIIKMCEAFQQQGVQTTLIVPFRSQSEKMQQVFDLWAHYDVETPFGVKHLFALDFIPWENRLPQRVMLGLYYVQCLLFSLVAVVSSLWVRNCVFYSRDLQTILFLRCTKWIHRKPVYFEAHEFHGRGDRPRLFPRLNHYIMRWMMQGIDGVITITQQLRACYLSLGVDEQKIVVAPDGIDAKRLTRVRSQADDRQKLQISLDRKIVCYTGHLFQWKGVYVLAESMQYLPEEYLLYLVGGMRSDINALHDFIAARRLKNIVVTGYVPPVEVPGYLSSADVLVLPNSAQARISREFTSPLKLFEYMGAQRPIVASELPSLKEILHHGQNAYLVAPDDPKALAAGILCVTRDRALSERIAKTAYHDVRNYTWQQRAKTIIERFYR